MTQKQIININWTWAELNQLCKYIGGAVTAGELAKAMGISRNTAKKYLQQLITNGGAASQEVDGLNKQKWTIYYAIQPEETK